MSTKKLKNISTVGAPHFDIGQRLRTAIENSGLKEIELARKMGIDKSTLSKYISGLHAFSYEVLAKVVKFTNCEAAWLLTGEGEMMRGDIAQTGEETAKEKDQHTDTSTSIDQLMGGTGMYTIGDVVHNIMVNGTESQKKKLRQAKEYFMRVALEVSHEIDNEPAKKNRAG